MGGGRTRRTTEGGRREGVVHTQENYLYTLWMLPPSTHPSTPPPNKHTQTPAQDRFKVQQGSPDLLAFNRLTVDSQTTAVHSVCCQTCLFAINVKNAPTLLATAETLTPMRPCGVPCDPLLRWWAAQIPEEKLGKMSVLPTPKDARAMEKFLEISNAPLPDEFEGSTRFMALFEACGGEDKVEVIGAPGAEGKE